MSAILNSVNACKRYYHILWKKKGRKLSRTTNVLLLQQPLNTKTSSSRDESIYFILSASCINTHTHTIIGLRDVPRLVSAA